MVMSKKVMLVATLVVVSGLHAGEQAGQRGGWHGWVGSFFSSKPAPVQSKRFEYRGRTPQDVAYEDLVFRYGCNSNDPKALCNIKIPKIELYEDDGPAYESLVTKRATAQKPVAYAVQVHKQEPTLRSYIHDLLVPKFWAGLDKRGEKSAISHIRSMKDRPDLEKMIDENTAENYHALVEGVKERMEEAVIKKALDDVKRNQGKIIHAYIAADDKVEYAQQVLQECSLKHTRSAECSAQKMYLDDINKKRSKLYQVLEPERKALEDAMVNLELRKWDLKGQRFARYRATRQQEEDRAWRDWLLKQEIGE